MEIKRGDRVLAASADGVERQLRALGGVVAGGDFAVVWVCTEQEWATAEHEARDPKGIPWPAEDVKLPDREAVPA
jgi:hypothetical protein